MKATLTILIALILSSLSNAQQFSFSVCLSDENGHSDTITLGYDPLASDSIDAAFGEVNIINNPWDSIFEARISPATYNGAPNLHVPVFHLKKQIVQFNPQPPYNPYQYSSSFPVFIEVYSAENRPVFLKWDSGLFADSSRNKSYFDFVPGVVCGAPICPLEMFDSLAIDGFLFDNSYYLNNNDTIWLIQFSFVSYTEVGLDELNSQQVNTKVYPNPADDFVTFDFEKTPNINCELLVFDCLGNKIRQEIYMGLMEKITLMISDFKPGVYLYVMKNSEGKITSGKFIKN